jgi:hypothetical protein
MGAVTYPHPAVSQLINDRFVPVRLNERDTSTSAVEALRTYRLLWSPGFVFLDQRGSELRRFVGYLPPDDFLAELHVALGFSAMLRARYDESYREFRVAADRFPESPAAAEAIYWAGIAAYRRDGRKMEILRSVWAEIPLKYPKSTWWKRADVFDVNPAEIFAAINRTP